MLVWAIASAFAPQTAQDSGQCNFSLEARFKWIDPILTSFLFSVVKVMGGSLRVLLLRPMLQSIQLQTQLRTM